jgi:hypothetical protein
MTLPIGTTRIRHLASGLVLARTVADARELAATHPTEYAIERDPAARSIPERLEAMGEPALRAFAIAHKVPAPAAAPAKHVIAQLTPCIERGEITLPLPEAA